MEGFEQLVRLALELETNDDGAQRGMVVTGNVKFRVRKKTGKKSAEEKQEHGYEVDVVASRSDLLVLASVKSYFGSRGVSVHGFKRPSDDVTMMTPRRQRNFKRHLLFNDEEIRRDVIQVAAKRYGYSPEQIELRLYIGRFASPDDEAAIKEHLGTIQAGRGPIKVIAVNEILAQVFSALESKTYRSDPIIATLRAMVEAISRSNGGTRGKALRVLRRTLGIPNSN